MKIALCAIMQKYETEELHNWIKHHLAKGFSDFFIYTFGEIKRRDTRLFEKLYRIKFFLCKNIHTISAFNNFIRNYSNQFEYAAFAHVGQYIVVLGEELVGKKNIIVNDCNGKEKVVVVKIQDVYLFINNKSIPKMRSGKLEHAPVSEIHIDFF
jgi:hypothetical protein